MSPHCFTKLAQSLRALQIILGHTTEQMCQLLKLTSLTDRHLSRLPLQTLESICQQHQLSLERMFNPGYTLEDLEHHFYRSCSLPERYQHQAFSYRATAMYMVNFLERYYGKESLHLIERKLGLHHQLFYRAQDTHNILLTLDLCRELARFAGAKEVFHMGHHFYETWKDSEFFAPLTKQKKVGTLFECMIEELAPKSIEKNYHWKIQQLKSNSLIILGQPNPEVYDQLITPGDPQLFLLEQLRQGFISSLPRFMGAGPGQVQMLRSIAAGHRQDLIEVQWT